MSRCDLDLWLLTLKMCGVMIKLRTKFDRDRSIRRWVIDDLAIFSMVIFKLYSSQGWAELHQIWGEQSSVIDELNVILWCMRCFISKWLKAAQRRVVSKIEAKFHTLWPPVKIRGEFGRMLRWRIEYSLRPNLRYTFNGRPLRGVEV